MPGLFISLINYATTIYKIAGFRHALPFSKEKYNNHATFFMKNIYRKIIYNRKLLQIDIFDFNKR